MNRCFLLRRCSYFSRRLRKWWRSSQSTQQFDFTKSFEDAMKIPVRAGDLRTRVHA